MVILTILQCLQVCDSYRNSSHGSPGLGQLLQISPWLVLPAIILLMGPPSLFSTLNDKRIIVVPTPGPVRVVIELLLYCVAAVTPWVVWPTFISVLAVIIAVASVIAGIPRFRWLLAARNSCKSCNLAMHLERSELISMHPRLVRYADRSPQTRPRDIEFLLKVGCCLSTSQSSYGKNA